MKHKRKSPKSAKIKAAYSSVQIVKKARQAKRPVLNEQSPADQERRAKDLETMERLSVQLQSERRQRDQELAKQTKAERLAAYSAANKDAERYANQIGSELVEISQPAKDQD